MKFETRFSKNGRIRKAFLLFPRTIKSITKWWTQATWEEELVRYGYSQTEWIPIRWIEE